MPLRTFRFITLMLAALAMSLSFCHLMEMPARMTWEQSLWVESTVHGGLYRMFGSLGAVIVVGAVVTTIALAVLLRRHRHPAFLLAAAGAGLFALSLASWWAIVFPANMELATWLDGPVPPDWSATRLRWETGHAIGAVLQLAGFSLLLASVLGETPPPPSARTPE